MRNAILLLLMILCLDLSAQQEDLGESTTYEIGNVKVIGAVHSDPEAIIAVSGLKVGSKIDIPGIKINKAMKALWDLQLFQDLEIRQAKVIEDVVFLEIEILELPRLGEFSLKGIKKSEEEYLLKEVAKVIHKGRILTKYKEQQAKEVITNYYDDKGYPDAVIFTKKKNDTRFQNTINLEFDIDKRKKVKILQISFAGNENISTRKLKKLMTFTNEKKRLFKKSLLTEEGFNEDKKAIIYYYQTKGFLDAQIIADSAWVNEENDWCIHLIIDEGLKYNIKNIVWEGNSVYPDEVLQAVLDIKKGDVYDPHLLEQRLQFSPDGRDISAIYMDNGYLFFKIESEETSIVDDSISLRIKIQEGPIATIGKVSIKGNTVTKEEVIRREIRTLPGDRFSRAAVIRSQREIINLGFFNPETIDMNTTVHPETGTVDLEYIVEEKSSDQFELSAGWDPASNQLIGTLGLSFNNISMNNLFDPSAWNPFPRGDGQRFSIRLQSTGKQYQSYNFSFSDPWLGGKKPTNLTVGGFFTNRRFDTDEGVTQRFNILGLSGNVSTRLQWPDDNFVSSTSLHFNRITLDDWSVDGFQLEDGTPVSDGVFNNFYIKQTFSRHTLNHPVFPTRGSNISWSIQFTPPYSLFNGSDPKVESPAETYKWLEYYKTRFSAEAYQSLGKKLVLKGSAKLGLVGAYNNEIGLSPFERFWFGGNGLDAQQGFTGIDLISMRGYNATSDFPVNENGGATFFQKYSAELRYPIVQSAASTIYLTGFVEAGNAWNDLDKVNPFDLKKSAGLGLRIHLPMFGLIGFDYGIGFDKTPTGEGGYLSRYGRINLVLGFEPD